MDTAELGNVDIGGVILAYRAVGEPAGSPMVLLHGLGDDQSCWNDVLASAVEQAGAEPAAYTAARKRGAKLAGGELMPRLAALGYEPFQDADSTIRLRNCPFDALTQGHPPLVCGLNLALLAGLAGDGSRAVQLRARRVAAWFTLHEPHPAPGTLAV